MVRPYRLEVVLLLTRGYNLARKQENRGIGACHDFWRKLLGISIGKGLGARKGLRLRRAKPFQ